MRQHKQQGLSALGILLVLAIAGFFLTIATKVGPLYLDNSFVNAALQSLASEPIHKLSDGKIRRRLQDSFTINNIRDVNAKDTVIERKKTATTVTLDYERRVNFFANVDVVVVFENTYDTSAR
ncbi:MAG: DUF4845 domain-containing protein [Gammaproteobacteria bacterium]|nr:DUF4845 domain-containing protein [Gammaproteobacteria bacterium]MBQ0839779.1 DUF4845 domain-containing protein [Gammaproteobacteria bacterium]